MRFALILFSLPLLAVDFTSTANFSISPNAGDAVVSYTIPIGDIADVCEWEWSLSNTYSPLIPDVNTSLYSGSNLDDRTGSQGAGAQRRTFIVGRAGQGITYAPVAADNKRYTRTLQANTVHYGRVTCPMSGDFATVSFTTANVIPGDTYPDAFWPVDPSTPGVPAWPTIDMNSVSTGFVHPVTGMLWQPLLRPDFESGSTADNDFHHVYQATGWTNPNNMLANDGSLAVTSNTNPAVVTTNTWDLTGPNNGQTLAGLTLEIKGYVSDACSAGDDRKVVVDGVVRDGVNAWSSSIEATLPTQTVYGAGTTTNVGDDPTSPVAYMQAWFSGAQLFQPEVSRAMSLILNDLNPRYGNYNRSGNDLTVSYPGSASSGLQWESFSTDLVNGSHIILDSGGTPTETTFTAITSATQATVAAGSGPTTNAQFIAPNFGFKLHKKTSAAMCSMSIDYIHFQKTYYSTPQLNGGSGNSRQTPLTKFPEGEVVTGATNASPIVLTLNNGVTAHSFSMGDSIHCFEVKGNTAANGTFTVSATTMYTVTLQGSTGNGTFSGNGACYSVSPAAKKGYFYQMSNEGDGAMFLWINTDQVPADIRFLGFGWVSASGFPSDGIRADNYSLDDSSSDSPGFYVAETASSKQHILHGVYIGNPDLGLMKAITGFGNETTNFANAQASWRWTDQTPTTTLTDQLAAFDATYTGAYAAELAPIGLLNSTTLVLNGTLPGGSQNAAGWSAVWDTGTKTVKGLVNTWTSPNWRWKGTHGHLILPGSTVLGRAGYPLNGQAGAYSGPYTITLTDNGLNTTVLQDCAVLLSGLGLPNPLSITGNQCSKTTLSTITPVTEGTPMGHTFGPIIVGDLYDNWTSADTDDGETGRILGISGSTVVVQRAMWSDHPIRAHPAGSKLWFREQPPFPAMAVDARGAFYSDTGWWDYGADPHGANTGDPYQQQLPTATVIQEQVFTEASHIGGRGDHFISDSGPNAVPYTSPCTPQSQNRFGGIRHGNYKSTVLTCYNANPAFDGSAGGGVGAASMETHLGALIETGTQAARAFSDARVYQASEGWQQTLAKVGGLTNWYLATGYNEFGNTYDYKRQKANVWIGTHIGNNVSSPSYDISAHDTTADAYNYCRAYKTNDCFTGSAANNVYVNIPQFALPPANWPFGSGTYRCLGFGPVMSHDADDLCSSLEPIQADNLMQYASSASLSDPAGTGQRRLGIPFTNPKWLNGTNLNTNILPDGSATAVTNFLVNLPTFNWDTSINRTTWLPISVSSGAAPAGTARAYVQFGYNPSYYCSDRQEACAATASTIQSGNSVYSFKTSDAPTGIACVASCTVVIPALSQRTMWYQWLFFDAMGMSTGTGSVNVISTETTVTPPAALSTTSTIRGNIQMSGRPVLH